MKTLYKTIFLLIFSLLSLFSTKVFAQYDNTFQYRLPHYITFINQEMERDSLPDYISPSFDRSAMIVSDAQGMPRLAFQAPYGNLDVSVFTHGKPRRTYSNIFGTGSLPTNKPNDKHIEWTRFPVAALSLGNDSFMLVYQEMSKVHQHEYQFGNLYIVPIAITDNSIELGKIYRINTVENSFYNQTVLSRAFNTLGFHQPDLAKMEYIMTATLHDSTVLFKINSKGFSRLSSFVNPAKPNPYSQTYYTRAYHFTDFGHKLLTVTYQSIDSNRNPAINRSGPISNGPVFKRGIRMPYHTILIVSTFSSDFKSIVSVDTIAFRQSYTWHLYNDWFHAASMYVPSRNGKYIFGTYISTGNEIQLFRYRVSDGFREEVLSFKNNNVGSGVIHLTPERKLLLRYNYEGTSRSHLDALTTFDNLEANSLSEVLRVNHKEVYDAYSGAPWHHQHPSYPQIIDFSTTLNCRGLLQLNNKSDVRFDSAVWHIHPHKSSVEADTVFGYRAAHNAFQDTGRYTITMESRTPAGYRRWSKKSIHVTSILRPSFSIDSSRDFCQHAAVYFHDSSFVKGWPASQVLYQWYWGDGTSSGYFGTDPGATRPFHIYRSSGTYQISLVLSTPTGCSDTFTRIQSIFILPAPDPRISVSDTIGCTPLTVHFAPIKRDSLTISSWYTITKGHSVSIAPHLADTLSQHTFNNPGLYNISHYTRGATGCITVDSHLVRVFPGMLASDSLQSLHATFTPSSDSIIVHWQRHPAAGSYTIRAQSLSNPATSFTSSSTDTFFLHPLSKPAPWRYTVTAMDSCGTPSRSSSIAPIWLSPNSTNSNSNLSSALTWTAYRPSIQYSIFKGDASITDYSPIYQGQSLISVNSTSRLTWEDPTFLTADPAFAGHYYRIQSQVTPNFTTLSNTLTLPYTPQAYIPNSFSPNGDGRNDSWTIQTVAIQSLDLQIYNRWGAVVWSSNSLNPSWTPKESESIEGVFLYRLSYIDLFHQRHHLSGTLHLLK